MTSIPVFDGHNDTLLRLAGAKTRRAEDLFKEGDGRGHVDLPRARQGHFAGGLFAIFPPPKAMPDMAGAMRGPNYDLPLPDHLGVEAAQTAAVRMAAIFHRLERAMEDDFAICRTAAEIRAAMAKRRLAAVLHLEGAEPIDGDFMMLDLLYAAGLRSLGPVWSRPNIFAHGVPFRFPGTPDTGPGLTDLGRVLVRECNARKIMIDLSHLNEKGFWEVAQLSHAPLVATHSNVHALCPSSRNLTDRQLDAIRDSRGMVGLNFATCFLRPDGAMRADTAIDLMVRHIDALVDKLGEDGVGFGSDFDGAIIPAEIGNVAGLPQLIEALRRSGYSEPLLAKIAHGNWISLLERTWA